MITFISCILCTIIGFFLGADARMLSNALDELIEMRMKDNERKSSKINTKA